VGHGRQGRALSSLLKFFGLTFALSWGLWSLAALVPVGTPARVMLFLPGTFAPAFVALWLAGRSVAEGAFLWRVKARWYLVALFYMAAVKLAAAVAHRLASGAWPAIEADPWYVFLGGTLVSTPFQAGEEIGWRGFALPRLSDRVGLGAASLVVGVIWAVWHLPLFLIAGTDTTGQSFPFFVLTVTAISAVLGWLYARTSGSLLLVMLMHAAANNIPHFIPPPVSGNIWELHATLAQVLTAAFLWIGAGFLLYSFRKLGYSPTAGLYSNSISSQ
jgi:CAAX protease family protein